MPESLCISTSGSMFGLLGEGKVPGIWCLKTEWELVVKFPSFLSLWWDSSEMSSFTEGLECWNNGLDFVSASLDQISGYLSPHWLNLAMCTCFGQWDLVNVTQAKICPQIHVSVSDIISYMLIECTKYIFVEWTEYFSASILSPGMTVSPVTFFLHSFQIPIIFSWSFPPFQLMDRKFCFGFNCWV